MIGFSKMISGKATVAAAMRARQSSCIPAHLLQFSTVDRPVVVWNVTRRCNLHCHHCYIEAEDGSQAGELTTQEGLELINQLVGLKIPVLLFSGGEPLLREDIWILARVACERGLRIALSTNGTLIDQDVAVRLQDSGFSYIGVSIDGRPETHDRFRGLKGSFDQAMAGIRRAQQAGLKAGIRFTVNSENYQDLPYLFDLVREEGISRFCLYHLVYAGRGRKLAASDLSLEQKRRMAEMIIEQVVLMEEAGVEVEVLSTDHHADGIFLYRWIQEHRPERAEEVKHLLEMHGGCSAGVKMANIDPQGYVYPCQFWHHQSLGRFPDKTFQEIWYDEQNELLKSLRDKSGHLKGRCGGCQARTLCGGCRIRAYAATGDLWGDDPVCYLTDEEIKMPI